MFYAYMLFTESGRVCSELLDIFWLFTLVRIKLIAVGDFPRLPVSRLCNREGKNWRSLASRVELAMARVLFLSLVSSANILLTERHGGIAIFGVIALVPGAVGLRGSGFWPRVGGSPVRRPLSDSRLPEGEDLHENRRRKTRPVPSGNLRQEYELHRR